MNDTFYVQLSIWSQIVASLLFIVALVFLWIKFIAPAVLASQARKNAELAEAERRRDAAQQEVDAAQTENVEADADVHAIRMRAESDARRIRERLHADAVAEGERLVRTAGLELDRARGAARERLRDDLLERAMQIAREAASRIDAATDRRLTSEAIDVAERPGAGGLRDGN